MTRRRRADVCFSNDARNLLIFFKAMLKLLLEYFFNFWLIEADKSVLLR